MPIPNSFTHSAPAWARLTSPNWPPPRTATCPSCARTIGAGYIEEWPIARLYRQGTAERHLGRLGQRYLSRRAACVKREPRTAEVFLTEVGRASGANAQLDRAINALKADLTSNSQEDDARNLVERMALTLQGAMLVQHAPAPISDAFCASRLACDAHHTYGAHRTNLDIPAILTRAMPS